MTLNQEWGSCLEARRTLSQGTARAARAAGYLGTGLAGGSIRDLCANKQSWQWSWEDLAKGIRQKPAGAPPGSASASAGQGAAAVDGPRGASLVGAKRPYYGGSGPGRS